VATEAAGYNYMSEYESVLFPDGGTQDFTPVEDSQFAGVSILSFALSDSNAG
jgi:hypothetical protein